MQQYVGIIINKYIYCIKFQPLQLYIIFAESFYFSFNFNFNNQSSRNVHGEVFMILKSIFVLHFHQTSCKVIRDKTRHIERTARDLNENFMLISLLKISLRHTKLLLWSHLIVLNLAVVQPKCHNFLKVYNHELRIKRISTSY